MAFLKFGGTGISLGALLTALSACGGDGNPTTSGAANSDDQPGEQGASDEQALRIMQWSHFVPQHDRWFDPFAKDWADSNNVKLSIQHIPSGRVTTELREAIEAGEGPDLVEVLWSPGRFEADVVDMTDVVEQLNDSFGAQQDYCKKSSFNPFTKRFYGFAHGWVPDPGNYRKSLWSQHEMEGGPTTWEQLLEAGEPIAQESGLPVFVGLADEFDSNKATLAVLWSFGASVQDESENIVLDSPETRDAMEFMAKLYEKAMSHAVIADDLTPASNNVAWIDKEASFIVNAISAYRTAQKEVPEVGDDTYFVRPLKGPTGIGLGTTHVIPIYVIPKYSPNIDTAKSFLIHLVNNYNNAVFNTELFTFPCWEGTTPQLFEENGWLEQDPFKSRPTEKLEILAEASKWTVNIGHPGPANAAISEMLDEYTIPRMFRRRATGEMTTDEAIAEAMAELEPIFEKWRNAGLIGGR